VTDSDDVRNPFISDTPVCWPVVRNFRWSSRKSDHPGDRLANLDQFFLSKSVHSSPASYSISRVMHSILLPFEVRSRPRHTYKNTAVRFTSFYFPMDRTIPTFNQSQYLRHTSEYIHTCHLRRVNPLATCSDMRRPWKVTRFQINPRMFSKWSSPDSRVMAVLYLFR
jgi:hypothetical protein